MGFVWQKMLAPSNQQIHWQNLFVGVCATEDYHCYIVYTEGKYFWMVSLGLYRPMTSVKYIHSLVLGEDKAS